MKKIKDKIRHILRQWLGIDAQGLSIARTDEKFAELMSESSMLGIDWGKEQTTIVFMSHLNGGYVKIIECQFKDFREMTEHIKRMEAQWNPVEIYFDGMPGMSRHFKESMGR